MIPTNTKLVTKKSAQDIQDDIFRKMSTQRKFQLTSDFSMFLLKLNRLGNPDGFSKPRTQSRKNS